MIELPQGYYLTNFTELVSYVFEQYEDLLDETERDFYLTFSKLSSDAQKLYVRMLTRKGNLFRLNKLQYAEIENSSSSAKELEKHRLISIDDDQPISNLLPLFSKPEWLKILSQLELEVSVISELKKLKRAELDSMLLEIGQELSISELIEENILELLTPQYFDCYKLLFFGNLNQDLTEFVLRDLGLYQFENYVIDKSARLFTSRNQINAYLDYYKLLENLDEVILSDAEDIIEFHRQLPDKSTADKTLSRRIQRVTLTLARQLERLEALDEALQLYHHCELPPARERCARILVKQNKINEALSLCKSIDQSPFDESEAIFANDFGYRTAKKHQIQWTKPVVYQPQVETIKIEQTEQGVELDAADYFSQFGQCIYVENALFCSLFGLHFWEMIFAPVRGAFTNPFQYRPHDLYEKDFITSRQELFSELNSNLSQIQNNFQDYQQMMKEKRDIASPFVFWDLLDENLLKLALDNIPESHWQAIFKRLWLDIRANRSGFPDLILFADNGDYQLIEIKGPGDRLQKNQIRWMQYFAEHQIPHKVVHVEWQ